MGFSSSVLHSSCCHKCIVTIETTGSKWRFIILKTMLQGQFNNILTGHVDQCRETTRLITRLISSFNITEPSET